MYKGPLSQATLCGRNNDRFHIYSRATLVIDTQPEFYKDPKTGRFWAWFENTEHCQWCGELYEYMGWRWVLYTNEREWPRHYPNWEWLVET